jgi:hypothetical protein
MGNPQPSAPDHFDDDPLGFWDRYGRGTSRPGAVFRVEILADTLGEIRELQEIEFARWRRTENPRADPASTRP